MDGDTVRYTRYWVVCQTACDPLFFSSLIRVSLMSLIVT